MIRLSHIKRQLKAHLNQICSLGVHHANSAPQLFLYHATTKVTKSKTAMKSSTAPWSNCLEPGLMIRCWLNVHNNVNCQYLPIWKVLVMSPIQGPHVSLRLVSPISAILSQLLYWATTANHLFIVLQVCSESGADAHLRGVCAQSFFGGLLLYRFSFGVVFIFSYFPMTSLCEIEK